MSALLKPNTPDEIVYQAEKFIALAEAAGFEITYIQPGSDGLFWAAKPGAEWGIRVSWSWGPNALIASVWVDGDVQRWLQGLAHGHWSLSHFSETVDPDSLAPRYQEYLEAITLAAEKELADDQAERAASQRLKLLRATYGADHASAVVVPFGSGRLGQSGGDNYLALKLHIPEDKIAQVLEALAQINS